VSVIALTGATGFVGSHLAHRLARSGHEVRALLRSDTAAREINVSGLDPVIGRLGHGGARQALVKGADTVIHVAGLTKAVDPSVFHETNCRATAQLVADADRAGVGRCILVSSLAAIRPEVSAYAWSKALGETAARNFAGGMDLTVVRPPAVLGPGDAATHDLFRLLRRGWLVCPAEAGEARTFSWIDVADLAGHIGDLVDAPQTRRVPEMTMPCSGMAATWQDVADAATEVLGRQVRCLRMPRGLVQGLGALGSLSAGVTRRPLMLSTGKARELLSGDWSANFVLEDASGLRETLTRCLSDVRGHV